MAVSDLVAISSKPAVAKPVLGEAGFLVELARCLAIVIPMVGAHPSSIVCDVLTVLSSGLGFGSCETVRETGDSGGEKKMVVSAIQAITGGVPIEETLRKVDLSLLSPVDPIHAGIVTGSELFPWFTGGIGTRSAINVTTEGGGVGVGHPINHTLAGGDGSLTEISAHIVLIVKGGSRSEHRWWWWWWRWLRHWFRHWIHWGHSCVIRGTGTLYRLDRLGTLGTLESSFRGRVSGGREGEERQCNDGDIHGVKKTDLVFFNCNEKVLWEGG